MARLLFDYRCTGCRADVESSGHRPTTAVPRADRAATSRGWL
jgi:hypothetical protein